MQGHASVENSRFYSLEMFAESDASLSQNPLSLSQPSHPRPSSTGTPSKTPQGLTNRLFQRPAALSRCSFLWSVIRVKIENQKQSLFCELLPNSKAWNLILFASKCVQCSFASHFMAVSLHLSYLLNFILAIFLPSAAFQPQLTSITNILKQTPSR